MIRRGPLVFHYHAGQQRLAEGLASAADPLPAMPGVPAEVLAEGEISVYLAADRASFDSLAPGAPDWSGGLAYPEGDRIVIPTFATRSAAEMITVLRHELAHIAIGRYLGPAAPRWFHEGYAQLASGSWRAEDAWTLRVAMLLGRLPSTGSLNLGFRRDRLSAEHAYLLAYTVVEYLYRLGGPDGFAALLARWRETGDLDRALRATYGITEGQFERLWRQDLSRRFGWLLVLAQTAIYWTLLTILLLVLGYWNKRRKRSRLAALEAAVQREAEERAEWGGGEGVVDHSRGQIDAEDGVR